MTTYEELEWRSELITAIRNISEGIREVQEILAMMQTCIALQLIDDHPERKDDPLIVDAINKVREILRGPHHE